MLLGGHECYWVDSYVIVCTTTETQEPKCYWVDSNVIVCITTETAKCYWVYYDGDRKMLLCGQTWQPLVRTRRQQGPRLRSFTQKRFETQSLFQIGTSNGFQMLQHLLEKFNSFEGSGGSYISGKTIQYQCYIVWLTEIYTQV